MANNTPPFLKVSMPTPTFADLKPTEAFGVIRANAILSGSVISHAYPTYSEALASVKDLGTFAIVRQTLELIKIVTVTPVVEET